MECALRRIRRCVELLLLLLELASEERWTEGFVIEIVGIELLLLLLAFLKSDVLFGLELELELVAWMC